LDSGDFNSGLTLNDVSILLPDRKKGNLIITSSHVVVAYQLVPLVVPIFSVQRKDLKVCLILHVPDKAKPQWNVTLCGTKTDGSSPEPLIQFTIQEQPGSKICSLLPGIIGVDPSELTTRELIPYVFKFVPIVESDTGRGLCVSGHRGSKEGLLYFLEEWIFFGFKKPMILIPINSIESVSYSAITRITFNVIVKLVGGQEFEFSMIDQGEYEAINQYVVTNQLSNQSMSEARRAKQSVKPEFSNELQELQDTLENDSVEKVPEGAQSKDRPDMQDDSDDEDEDENFEIASDHDSDSEEDESEEDEAGNDESEELVDEEDEEDEDED
jgi:hypothetical protein